MEPISAGHRGESSANPAPCPALGISRGTLAAVPTKDHRARRWLRAARRASSTQAAVWKRALPSEVDFWKGYIETGGGEFPDDFRTRLDPSAPIEDQGLLAILDQLPGDGVAILDVGAGPLTCVGKVDPSRPGRKVEIVAADPLADDYRQLLDSAGIKPPVITQVAKGEEVADVFGRGRFDIVHARNSVDHSMDAMAVVRSMFEAVRIGGFVYMHHYRREGELMRYEELHQWNFDVEDDRLIIFNRRRRYDLAEELGPGAEVATDVHAGGYHAPWVAATIRRISD